MRKRWKETILLTTVSVVIALALAEIMLRLLGISYPSFYRPDPIVGSALRPGAKGYWLEEGGGWVSINSDGLRDREHSVQKPPNSLRIAVLGDSYAEAFQVDQDKTFWAVMEKQLQGCQNVKGRHVEVINFGQSGFGTAMELLALRHRVWKYSPDIVLLAFLTGNDISDNSRALKKNERHPYFVYDRNRLVPDDEHVKDAYKKYGGWRNDLRASIYNSLRLFQVVDRGATTIGEWYSRASELQLEAQTGAAEPGLYTAIYLEPPNETWREAWHVTEGLLLLMRDEIRDRGAQFFVTILSNGIEVHPDPEVRRAFQQGIGVEDLSYAVRRIEDFCGREGIPALALTPRFRDYAEKKKIFLHGFGYGLGGGHWNENGHRLAGEMISQWLCENLKNANR